MPRKKFYPTSEFPYHVTARTVNKEWFHIPMSEVWSIYSYYLNHIWREYDIQIHSFVLMNNHFHMLASTPEANLDKCMNYLMRETSKKISERAGRVNQVYGGPYRWSVIANWTYYQHAYKYVYRNPVQAGLCDKVEEYSFSTLPGVLGLDYQYIPTYDNMDLIQDPSTQLQWLNTSYDDETRLAIQLALRRRDFGFSKDKKTGGLHSLESIIP